MPANDKKALRRLVRTRFDAASRNVQSERICSHVLAWEVYRRAKVIGGYMPMGHEADVTPILWDALTQGKTLALPRCGCAPEMTFHRVGALEELACGAYGLKEPAPSAPLVAPEEIDLLLTPLEAIDRQGMRLGKGGGYYDRLLGLCPVPALGIALSWQWVEEVPAQPWDRPLTAAADEEGIHLFRPDAALHPLIERNV